MVLIGILENKVNPVNNFRNSFESRGLTFPEKCTPVFDS